MRFAAGLVLGAFALSVAGAAGPAGPSSAIDQFSAAGEGAFHFGKKGEGVGYFNFDVHAGSKPSGTFLFGAEDHHKYPDVVIRLTALERVVVDGRTVTIRGKGTQQQYPVHFTATATDGTGGKPDTFHIQTRPAQPGGEGEFHASGELFLGDVRVGAGET